MSYSQSLDSARAALKQARDEIQQELRDYPTPVSGCDAQYNHLIGMRGAITDALSTLATPRFVATPRTPEPMAGVESR